VYVAALLTELGWDARVTRATADSGVDVEAVLDGRKLVVQAKNHRQPAGRRAVQEAYTGKAEYDADEAWVVSTNGFTLQAKVSAGKLGVELVGVDELEQRADAAWEASAEARAARAAEEERETLAYWESRLGKAKARAMEAAALSREQERTRKASEARVDKSPSRSADVQVPSLRSQAYQDPRDYVRELRAQRAQRRSKWEQLV